MRLEELSEMYQAQSEVLSARIAEVSALEVGEAEWHFHRRRLRMLHDMLQEARALATLTANYYCAGHTKHGKFAL